MGKKLIIGLGAAVIVALAGAALYGLTIRKWDIQYEYLQEGFYNPLMGYAPSADYYEAALPENLVYIDITWAEWEPEEGVYAWEQVMEDNFIEEWKNMGKHAVLRFVCDIPDDEAHMDIPQWLYEQTGDGVTYDISYGRGYCPDYSNPVFIQKHESALKALGEACLGDGFIAYVELGSLGHWGEWHTSESSGLPGIPSEEVCAQYVAQYAEAFPDAKLMMRRNYTIGMERGFGVFNDMTGMAEDTYEWLGWMRDGGSYRDRLSYQPVEAIWNKAPVGGEFTSSLPMDTMLGSGLEETLSLISESHMTFIGPMCPIREEALTDGAEAVRAAVGYRYWIESMTVTENRLAGTLEIRLAWRNDGAAPMYFDWPVMLYVKEASDREFRSTAVTLSLSELLPGGQTETVTTVPYERVEGEEPVIGTGILDPDTGKPCVRLAMNTEFTEGIQILN